MPGASEIRARPRFLVGASIVAGSAIALFGIGTGLLPHAACAECPVPYASAGGRIEGTAPTLRGVNYAHEGYGGYEGYLSERSDASLARLAEMGANSVAILPYAFMRSPDEPSRLAPPTRQGAETDEAVIHAIRTATELGFTILLKPHVWVRGSWPGEIRMPTEAAWRDFFESYERWILHYARMAEEHDVPILSVGVELSAATLEEEELWVDLVEEVRAVYSGALVYSANWGAEAEELGFWDAFDYIGVNAYYPLDDRPDASDQDLGRGAERMLDRIERVHREHELPVLLTEIGFASSRAPWIRPWEGHLGDELDYEDQARSYRAVMKAVEGRDWIEGVFWWKWPSDPRRVDRSPRGFKPLGKPAQVVLEQWFQGSDQASPSALRLEQGPETPSR